MSEVLLHPSTKRAVDRFIARPAHAILLEGSTGVGKSHLATYVASQLLGIEHTKIPQYPYFLPVSPDKSISIEQIRELQKQFTLKIPGDRLIKRIALIEHAETMTTEAQNALLKLLEEPPADSVIILTSANINGLLPTIISRAQRITVNEPSENQMRGHFGDTPALKIASGLPGLAHSLVAEQDHPLAIAVTSAKQILAASTYDRLLLVNDLSKNRDEAASVLSGLVVVCRAALKQSASVRWQKALRATLEAQEALNSNANTKLTLTNLMLSL